MPQGRLCLISMRYVIIRRLCSSLRLSSDTPRIIKDALHHEESDAPGKAGQGHHSQN